MPVRNLPKLSLALLLAATAGASAHDSGSYVKNLQESLAASSASDFAASDVNPTGFRKVDLRYRENDHGARTYMLCGQVQIAAGTKATWVDFATVKTKPFEQWIGGAAIEICALATPVSPDDDDLSALIEARMTPDEIP
jgi:hypothetical protein